MKKLICFVIASFAIWAATLAMTPPTPDSYVEKFKPAEKKQQFYDAVASPQDVQSIPILANITDKESNLVVQTANSTDASPGAVIGKENFAVDNNTANESPHMQNILNDNTAAANIMANIDDTSPGKANSENTMHNTATDDAQFYQLK